MGCFTVPTYSGRVTPFIQSCQLSSKLSFVIDTFQMENTTDVNPSVGSSRYWDGAVAKSEGYALCLHTMPRNDLHLFQNNGLFVMEHRTNDVFLLVFFFFFAVSCYPSLCHCTLLFLVGFCS